MASGQPISALWAGYADPLAWGAILWASLGPGALAAFLQTQVRVRKRLCDQTGAFWRLASRHAVAIGCGLDLRRGVLRAQATLCCRVRDYARVSATCLSLIVAGTCLPPV